MTCYYPLHGWKSRRATEKGKRKVVFSLSEGLSDMPVDVPCGKCSGCRADQALMWSVRAYHESTQHLKNSFLTLTYSDENLPPDGKLDKAHLQNFFKRLRKQYPPKHIRYIACGEYGEKTRRPHYHAIIFGEDFLAADHYIKISDKLYTNTQLQETWGHGHVAIAEVNISTICYVCGYVYKKVGDPDTFNLMSRRPGIGSSWLNRYYDDLRRTGCVTIDGREFPIPRRYLELKEDELKEVIKKRRQYGKKASRREDGNTRRNREKNRLSMLDQRQEKI